MHNFPGPWKEDILPPVSSLRSCLILVPVLYSHDFIYSVFVFSSPFTHSTFYSSQKAGYCFLGKKVKHQREGKSPQNGICCTVVRSRSALRVRARAIYRSGNMEEMTGYHYIPPALGSVCDSSVLGVTWHL